MPLCPARVEVAVTRPGTNKRHYYECDVRRVHRPVHPTDEARLLGGVVIAGERLLYKSNERAHVSSIWSLSGVARKTGSRSTFGGDVTAVAATAEARIGAAATMAVAVRTRL